MNKQSKDGEQEEYKQPQIDFPEALKGRNIVFFGDSVDRQATHHMCEMFGSHVQPAWMNGKELDFTGGYGQHVCHLPNYNSTILFRAHMGAMSSTEESNWAKTAEMNWGGRNPNGG